MRKGPNDASCIVWALCDFFIYSYFIFVLKVIYRYYLCTEKFNAGKNSDNGPNDVRRVVWAMIKCFFFNITYYFTKVCKVCMHTYLSTLGPNNGLPSFGPNKYNFKYIFALFSSIYIYKLYFLFLLIAFNIGVIK